MDYQSSQKGPTIIITQTPYTSEILRIDIPSLRDMPLVPLLYPTEDGKIYKSLTWKNEFAELSFNRFFKMNDLWEEKLGISRFTHIPIGNLTTDIVIEASDIFYGRLLTFNRHLLWANTSALPDLGGYLMQNYIDSVFSNNGSITPFEQSNQGVYRSVCIELKIRNLVINTIRMSDHLSDMEDIETDDISQQFGFCDTAYNILRMLISRWISTAESTDLHLVDYFLGNCYRWLCSKSSLLYDPSIHSLICTLIKKVLLLILNEFRHLGANIIFASFDKIIFCSNKFTLESAKSYLQYILDTISNQELFKYLVFEPQIYWDSLIWMDSYNYGGIILESCNEEEESGEEEIGEENNQVNNEDYKEEEEKNKNEENNKEEVMEIEENNDNEEEEKENKEEEELDDDELKRIVEKNFRKSKSRNERTQQYHDSDSDDFDEEVDGDKNNNDNGMEEEYDDEDEEDETLNGFIVDDEEIETSTGKIFRTEKGEANYTLKQKQAEQQEQEQQTNGKKFSLHWLTATFLPAFLDAPFQVIIADFLLKPLNYRNDLIKDHPESAFDEVYEKMTDYTKIYIKEEVFPTLSKLVKNIHDKVIEDDPETKTDRTFPKFAGSHLNLTSPTLEYIKVVCKILSLEECIDLEVFRLKTNLLSLIKKRESSEECQYKNPCLSLIVTDVICSYCNECQNIDFCRDSSFLFPVNNNNNMWICDHCGHPYNKLSIEYKLVELLDDLISKYHYQDLRCVKCKNAKDDNLTSNCNCGGEYINSEISSIQYVQLLTPFENIANYHQLTWLKEVINTYKH